MLVPTVKTSEVYTRTENRKIHHYTKCPICFKEIGLTIFYDLSYDKCPHFLSADFFEGKTYFQDMIEYTSTPIARNKGLGKEVNI